MDLARLRTRVVGRQDKMKLGLSVRGIGYHVAAWRHPDVDPRSEMGLPHYLAAARTAKRGLFDMIFFADGVAIRENAGEEQALSGFSTLAWSDAEALNFSLKEQIDIDIRYEHATEFIDVVLGLWDSWDDDALLFDKVGDVSNYDVDDPLPQVENHRIQSIGKAMPEQARNEHLTIRQPYEKVANGRGHLSLVGSAEQVADTLVHWFERGACDGFNVAAPYLPGSLDDFVDIVVPILQDRGVFRGEYEGVTLRENLGLKYPHSRYAH